MALVRTFLALWAVAAAHALCSAEKESAAFALYTGVDSASGSTPAFLSRYRTSGETAEIAGFSSEKPPVFMLVIR